MLLRSQTRNLIVKGDRGNEETKKTEESTPVQLYTLIIKQVLTKLKSAVDWLTKVGVLAQLLDLFNRPLAFRVSEFSHVPVGEEKSFHR